jgi:antitoxin (DNA-binding transcriptional repressor) of toxin-antitoxin stability system
MHQITIQEARKDFDSMFSQVLKGEEIIITDHHKPVARVSPIDGLKRRGLLGSAEGATFYIAEDFDDPLEEFKEYM